LKPWYKPFQNLRSTRETELVKRHGIKAATTWIGNSEDVAKLHYLQIEKDDFEKAIKGPSNVVQNPVQSIAEMDSKALIMDQEPKIKTSFFQRLRRISKLFQNKDL
jgi:hypothetical protein